MIRFKRPNRIRKGMLLVERNSKNLFEVLRTTKLEFEVQNLFTRRKKTLTNAEGLYVLASPKLRDKIFDVSEFDPENDFVVLLDSEDFFSN